MQGCLQQKQSPKASAHPLLCKVLLSWGGSAPEHSSSPLVLRLCLLLSQVVTPLTTPDHQGDHGQGEEHGDEDEDGERVVRRVRPQHLLHGAVGEEVLVYADDVALHQGVGPVAVDILGLFLRAEGEDVVLTGERQRGRRGERLEENLF